MVSSQHIEDLILNVLKELGEDLGKPEFAGADAQTALFGAGGALDSLGLVQVIAELEARIAEELGQDVVIADERAMSRSRSPFRTVATLRDYLNQLLTTDDTDGHG